MKSLGKQPVFGFKTYSRRKTSSKIVAPEKYAVFMNSQEAPFSDSSTSINEEIKKSLEDKKSSRRGIKDISNMPDLKRQSKEENKPSKKMKPSAKQKCGEMESGHEPADTIEDVYNIFAEKARVTRSKTQRGRKIVSKPPVEIKEPCLLYENFDTIPDLMMLETPSPKVVLAQENVPSTSNEKSVDSCLNDKSNSNSRKSAVASKTVVMPEESSSAPLFTEYPESHQSSSVVQMEEEHEIETIFNAVTSTDSHVKKSETQKTDSYYTYYTHEWALVSDSDDSEPSIEILREEEVSFSILPKTSQFEFSEKMIPDSKNAFAHKGSAKTKAPFPHNIKKSKTDAQIRHGRKNSTLVDTNFAKDIEDVTMTEKISVIFHGADISSLKPGEDRCNDDPVNIHDPAESLNVTDQDMRHPVCQDAPDLVMPNVVDLVENVPCHGSQNPHRIISSTIIDGANPSDISIPDLSCIPGRTEGTEISVLKPAKAFKDIDDGPQKVMSSTRIHGTDPSCISIPDLSCITGKAKDSCSEPNVNIESSGLTEVIGNVDVYPDYLSSTRNKNTENVHPLEGLPDLSCIPGNLPRHDNQTFQLQTTPKTESLQIVLSKPSRSKRYSKQRHGQLQPKSSTFLFESQFINIDKIMPDMSEIVPNKPGKLFGPRDQTKPSNQKSHRSESSLKKSDLKQNDDPIEEIKSDSNDESHATETQVVHGVEGLPAKRSVPGCNAEQDKGPRYGLAAKQNTPTSSTPEHSKDFNAMEVDISEVPPPVYGEDELVMGATTRHCITDEIGFQTNDVTVRTENQQNSWRNNRKDYNPSGFPVCSLVAFPEHVRNKPSKLVFWRVSPRKWREIQVNRDTPDVLAMTPTARKLRTFSNQCSNTA